MRDSRRATGVVVGRLCRPVEFPSVSVCPHHGGDWRMWHWMVNRVVRADSRAPVPRARRGGRRLLAVTLPRRRRPRRPGMFLECRPAGLAPHEYLPPVLRHGIHKQERTRLPMHVLAHSLTHALSLTLSLTHVASLGLSVYVYVSLSHSLSLSPPLSPSLSLSCLQPRPRTPTQPHLPPLPIFSIQAIAAAPPDQPSAAAAAPASLPLLRDSSLACRFCTDVCAGARCTKCGACEACCTKDGERVRVAL
jgi:hypothetical protein